METGAIFQKSPWRAIISMSIPSLISILVMMLYNMADMYFVGWTGDLAQVGAVAILSQPEWKGKTAYFAGIDKARFRRKVMPGDVLMLETTIIKVKGPVGVGRAVAIVNGEKTAEAELTFAIG